ncbi:ribose-phosphate pyrophosphokinase [Weissella beninensis]|uniref:Putative ribose-phosphate pyrophosphokinase n=1 Tax=Periweissella beninensis TaxID=504936 RepID=A0ABT0VFF6_9LACO|nr:ribose-phosphate diphosphokinase [Periweissella beninensis]MBM7543574.1 ribose-phosphate pyrophosphokinase [Periweissella beninensis]MCM2436556.1 ribose-phosphate diphosphokinase [Periweissella beninensis]
MAENKNIKLFALNSNLPLAQKIADELSLTISEAEVKHFADGEIQISIGESVRGAEIYVIQAVADPVNTSLMELMIMVDALRRASAAKINVVMPYYGYARQDRKARSREPITAKLIASMLEMNGVDRVITIDLHADQVQGFFDIPIDHLLGAPLLANYFFTRHLVGEDVVVVSPSHSGVSRARKFAELLKAPIAIIDNRDNEKDTAGPSEIIGEVANKRAIIVDDIIDTGLSMSASAQALHFAGATEIYGVATHAVLSGDAVTILKEAPIKEYVTTDSINLAVAKQFPRLTQLSIGPLLAAAIERIHKNEAIEDLLKSPDNMDVQL